MEALVSIKEPNHIKVTNLIICNQNCAGIPAARSSNVLFALYRVGKN